MIQKNKENGFTLVEVLLVIIAIALLTLTGMYAYNSVKKEQPAADTKKSTGSLTQQAGNTTKYLQLQEIGVKIPWPEHVNDLNYEPAPAENIVGVSTQAYQDAVAACMPANTLSSYYRAILSVTRHSGTYDEAKQFDQIGPYGTFAKQFDGFYISYSTSDGGICPESTDPAATQKARELFNTLKPLLEQSIKNAEVI